MTDVAEAAPTSSPRNVRRYLRSTGWQEQDGAWLRSEGGDEFEVVVPSRPEAADYSRRLAEVLNTLSVVENRECDDVLRDLSTVNFDIQYVSLASPNTPSGTAPLRDVAAALLGAYEMLGASAESVEHTRLVHPSRHSNVVASFMRTAWAGPTQSGSYIISVQVKVPPQLSPVEDLVLFDVPDEPFERRATKMCHQALLAAHRVAARAADSNTISAEILEEQKISGLSANLCEALVKIGGEDRSPFGVDFAWALERPMVRTERSVRFDRTSLEVLAEVAREIRNTVDEIDAVVSGFVTRLHRDTQGGAGEVTIAGTTDSDGPLRKYGVHLSEADYEQAIQAHRIGEKVQITGSIRQAGNRRHLTATSGLRLLGGD
jgi:hypothetical protein